MRNSAKRGVLVVGAGLGLLVVFFPITYAITAYLISRSVHADYVAPEILAPKPPREGDDTMKRLFAIADELDWPEDDGCVKGVELEDQIAACRVLAERNAELIIELAAWAEDPSPFGPRQTEQLGDHSRTPVGVGLTAELPPLTSPMRLGDLLALEAELAYRDGDCAAGQRTLQLLFDLGAYLEQNPSTLLHEMVGLALSNKAAVAAARLVPAASVAEVATWLPTQETHLRSLQMSLGSEWLNMVTFLDEEMRQGTGPFDVEGDTPSPISWWLVEASGLYDPVHTRQMHDEFWKHVQDRTREPPLNRDIEIVTWEQMGLVRFFHNPIGRMLFTIATPSMLRFARKAGLSIDRVTALRAVLAARQMQARDGAWPDGFEALGSAAPRSALNGNELIWDQSAGGIRLYDVETDGLCEGNDDECLVPFAPAFEASCAD